MIILLILLALRPVSTINYIRVLPSWVHIKDIERRAYFEWLRTGNDEKTNWYNAEESFKINVWLFNVINKFEEEA